MSTTTDYLGLTDQATGENENGWGDVLDANIAILEEKTSKITPKTITGGTTALTANEAKVAVINLTGTLVSDAIVTVADDTKSAWMVVNGTSGSYSVTFKTVSGTGGIIGQGATAFCFSDGTNIAVTAVDFNKLTAMLDVNGFSLGDGTRKLLGFVEDASAVNHLEIENQATGSGPTLRAVGDDTDIDLNLESKGTGLVRSNAKLVGVRHVLSKSSAYTVVKADHGALIKCDATSAAFTITLPAAATAGSGFEIEVKKIDASANAITIDGDGSETIDGATTATVSARYDVLVIQCDGSNWNTIGKIVTATSAPNLGQTTLSKTSAYTVSTDDFGALVNCDASGAAFTVTLPTASSAGDGFEITVKKTDSSENAVTLDGDGSETIDGATTKALATQNESAVIRSDGSNWLVQATAGATSSGGSAWSVVATGTVTDDASYELDISSHYTTLGEEIQIELYNWSRGASATLDSRPNLSFSDDGGVSYIAGDLYYSRSEVTNSTTDVVATSLSTQNSITPVNADFYDNSVPEVSLAIQLRQKADYELAITCYSLQAWGAATNVVGRSAGSPLAALIDTIKFGMHSSRQANFQWAILKRT